MKRKAPPLPPPLPAPPTTPYPGSVAPPLPAPPAISPYRSFLNYLNTEGVMGGKMSKPKKISPKDIAQWEEPDAFYPPHEVSIYNEIAKGFNDNKTVGIPKITYRAHGPNSSSYYYADRKGIPNLDILPYNNLKDGPNPQTIAHELVHATDHQGKLPRNRLNPLIWGNLRNLATSPGSSGRPMTFPEFADSVGRIQDKITAPTTTFKDHYPFNEGYFQDTLGANHPGYNLYDGVGTKRVVAWPRIFNDINNVATSPPVPPPPMTGRPQAPQNEYFDANRASEFPAFMSENLTRPWGTNTGANPLSREEARFTHSTLGNMANSYTEADAPVTNHYIRERRNSIERAYDPANATYQAPHTPASQALGLPAPSLGLPSGTPFRHGGLATAIKQKRKGIFKYF